MIDNHAERRHAAVIRQMLASPIAQIWSAGYAEDGRTFCVMLNLEGGEELMLSICEGAPVSIVTLT